MTRTVRAIAAVRLALAVVVLATVPRAFAAPITWTQIVSGAPPARAASAMTYDASTGELVLFGGYTVDPATGVVTYLNETWTFDGIAWTLAASKGPSARAAATLVYDAVHDEVVLFGGYDGRLRLGDTWTWDGSHRRWRATKPRRSPRPVTGPMGFQDPGTGLACVFGGFDGQFYQNATWRWDGRTWTLLTPAHQPSARGAGVIGLDPVLHEVVVFGGLGDVNPNNTWTWDGTDWTLQNPSTQPPLRYYSAAGYDPTAGGVVLFAGGPGFGDTWLWTGSDWTELQPPVSPPARESHVMAYDEALGHAVIYGGEDSTTQYDDTWMVTPAP